MCRQLKLVVDSQSFSGILEHAVDFQKLKSPFLHIDADHITIQWSLS